MRVGVTSPRRRWPGGCGRQRAAAPRRDFGAGGGRRARRRVWGGAPPEPNDGGVCKEGAGGRGSASSSALQCASPSGDFPGAASEHPEGWSSNSSACRGSWPRAAPEPVGDFPGAASEHPEGRRGGRRWYQASTECSCDYGDFATGRGGEGDFRQWHPSGCHEARRSPLRNLTSCHRSERPQVRSEPCPQVASAHPARSDASPPPARARPSART